MEYCLQTMTLKTKNGTEFIIDDEDFVKVDQYTWHINTPPSSKTSYVMANISKKVKIKLHRFLLNVTNSKIQIDHINGNGLDNRKENLRLVTNAQNSRNKSKYITTNSTSKYKGVFFCKQRNKWVAQICLDYKKIFIGRFKTEIEAAKAYNEKALTLFGQYAKLNTIEEKL